jgi:hypothetical protein
MALAWLQEKATRGFQDWDSPRSVDGIVCALAHLTALAENETVREMAAIVLDKVFFDLAVNSFKGAYGSTQGRAYALALKTNQVQATSNLSRLLWGMGVWNRHIRGLVALASSSYELPTMIASIAVDVNQAMWHREHHPSVDKATFRTPDYMLASAQDYRPGEPGAREHVWQATLGPDVVVFVNHPVCASEDDARAPNFWAGNGRLPRVAQWKDVLIALYKLPEDAWLGFTHAHFPVYEFDEYSVQDNWAFARKGNGYLALTASAPLEFVHRGPGAFREVRVYGPDQAWICMMGRQETDGSFQNFQRRAKTLEIALQQGGVACQTLRDEHLAFSWQGPLRVDGQEQPLSSDKHYDGPHCVAEWPASQMDITYGDYAVRLCFDA